MKHLFISSFVLSFAFAPLAVAQDLSPGQPIPTPISQVNGGWGASISIPSCSTGSSALTWNSTTDTVGCLTGIAAGAGLGANTFTGTQTINQGTGYSLAGTPSTTELGYINFTGGSTAATQSAVNLSYNVTSSTVTPDVYKFVTNCTAGSCSSSSNLFVLYYGTTGNLQAFKVNGAGSATLAASLTLGGTASLSWNLHGNISSPNANQIQIGTTDISSAGNQLLSTVSIPAGNTDTTGPNLSIGAGKGTGAGAGGSIIFQVAPAGSTGTTQNSLVNAYTISQNLHLIPATNNPTAGTGAASVTGSDTAMTVTAGTSVNSSSVTFFKTWTATPAACVATPGGNFSVWITGLSSAGFTLNYSSAQTGSTVYVMCL